uniref:Uncharacterized protein n=1 Tax=Triticum urartu TaxID=4572 RepID=A0A8R7QH95_TRIUA
STLSPASVIHSRSFLKAGRPQIELSKSGAAADADPHERASHRRCGSPRTSQPSPPRIPTDAAADHHRSPLLLPLRPLGRRASAVGRCRRRYHTSHSSSIRLCQTNHQVIFTWQHVLVMPFEFSSKSRSFLVRLSRRQMPTW